MKSKCQAIVTEIPKNGRARQTKEQCHRRELRCVQMGGALLTFTMSKLGTDVEEREKKGERLFNVSDNQTC
jgi:hypothetical protein